MLYRVDWHMPNNTHRDDIFSRFLESSENPVYQLPDGLAMIWPLARRRCTAGNKYLGNGRCRIARAVDAALERQIADGYNALRRRRQRRTHCQ